ncbi:monovalent cation/H+ antiporter subunit D family protein [Natronomonas halophila]|uniref:proton-conducting transporter transmembrane domain-containing protein n=1 Tax=Natronomonas halophila TaxID=2747817 RepID=UPI0015B4ED96|nr:proton-conducting transporter membrane subunit [Natronomonas halophila]QLD86403.1 monovalent cation/H+ antiporter subunit D family protein [Natronomonas halophila]
MSNIEIPLLVAVPILLSTLPLLLGLRFEKIGWPIAVLGALVNAGLVATIGRRVATEGRLVHSLGGYPRQYGIELVADQFSVVVAALIVVVTLVVLGYARTAGPRRNSFYSTFLLLFGGLLGVSMTGDVFNLFVFLEITGLTTYALVASDRSPKSALASLKYLIIGTAGASLYLVGVGFLLVATGTLNMVELSTAIADFAGYRNPLIVAAFAFIVVGLSVKAAVFPLHTWMPDAYAESPDTVTAYISGLVSTVGAYAIARLVYTVFTPAFFEAVPLARRGLVAAGTVSILAGSILAVTQSDVKRMLAYSSVAQFGMIIAAFGLATEQALIGAVIHLVGHGIMKTGLFLAVGVLSSAYGVRVVSKYANLGYRSPVTVAAMGVLLLSLVGIPPSIGFLGKWYIAWGAVEAGAPIVAGVIFLSTLLTLLYAARLLETIYFRPAEGVEGAVAADDASLRSDGGADIADADPSVSVGMILAAVVMAVLAVGLGFSAPTIETFLAPFLEAVL